MLERQPSRILAVLLLATLLSGCGQMQPVGSNSDLITYTVKPGDTLYSIAWRYGYNPKTVAGWNKIAPPYTLYPGQSLLIIPPHQRRPRNDSPPTRSAATTRATAPAQVTSPAGTTTRRSPSASRSPVEKPATRLQNTTINWNWPTDGKVLTAFAPNKGKKGVDIGGEEGQSISAAADGTVVYSGSGLIGYGKLIIIKHNDTYLSAYGHNKRLLVKEGSKVRQGEKIAEMGSSGKEGIMLHFEIRRDGKPVDPMRYLPQQGT